jgi:hypothetical protein
MELELDIAPGSDQATLIPSGAAALAANARGVEGKGAAV